MTLLRDQPLSAIISHAPGAEDVFEECGIDYWFGGDKTLASACAAARIDVDALEKRLAACEVPPAEPLSEPFLTLLGELLAHFDLAIAPAVLNVRIAASELTDPRAGDVAAMMDAIETMTSAHAVLLRVRVIQEIAAASARIEQRVVRDLALQHALLAVRVRKLIALCSELAGDAGVRTAQLLRAAHQLAREIHHHIRISYEAVMPYLAELARRKRGIEPG
jgi:hypothetical protein